MKTIWKFNLNTTITIDIKVIKFLHLGYDPFDDLCVWAIVDPDEKGATRIFKIGTGWEFEDDITFGEYLGTVNEGAYVWHYFAKDADKMYLNEKCYNDKAQEFVNRFMDNLKNGAFDKVMKEHQMYG